MTVLQCGQAQRRAKAAFIFICSSLGLSSYQAQLQTVWEKQISSQLVLSFLMSLDVSSWRSFCDWRKWLNLRVHRGTWLPSMHHRSHDVRGLHPVGVCIRVGLLSRGHVTDPPSPRQLHEHLLRDTVNKRAVRILLECILVVSTESSIIANLLITSPQRSCGKSNVYGHLGLWFIAVTVAWHPPPG